MNEMFSQGGKGSTGILTNKQAIARKFGVKQNEVVYFSVGVDLGGYKVIYDKSTQRAYSLPVLPVGTTTISLNKHAVLVHSAGTVDLGELAATRREFVCLSDSFTMGLVVNTRNELLMHNGIGYTYLGTLPVTISAGTNPVGDDDWKPQTGPDLRQELISSTSINVGAGMVGYAFGNEYSAGSIGSALRRTVFIDDFIPSEVDTESTDCAEWISNAVRYAFTNHCKLEGKPGKVYGVGRTVLIPQNFDSTFTSARKQEIDGQGCTFKMLADVTLFESGYYNTSGDLVSNFGTEYDSHYSKYITLGNFTIIAGTPSGRLSAALLRIQDWHHGSKVHNIACNAASFGMHSINNYYMEYSDLVFEYPSVKSGDRFVFEGNINLNVFRRLIATNAEIQYRFDGPVTASVIDSVSLEGGTVGAQFSSEIFDLSVTNCYIENISDTAFYFGTYVHSAVFSNNYVNFVEQPTMYFLGYSPTPATNITIESSNYFSVEERILKTVENTYGNGIRIVRGGKFGSTLKSMIADLTTIGAKVGVDQNLYYDGFVGKKVNDLIPGLYAGKFTNGISSRHGFEWLNQNTPQLLLGTAMTHNGTELMYVNIIITQGSGNTTLSGLVIGGVFYKFSAGGVSLSSDLELDLSDSPYVRLRGSSSLITSTVTNVVGEIRLI